MVHTLFTFSFPVDFLLFEFVSHKDRQSKQSEIVPIVFSGQFWPFCVRPQASPFKQENYTVRKHVQPQKRDCAHLLRKGGQASIFVSFHLRSLSGAKKQQSASH